MTQLSGQQNNCWVGKVGENWAMHACILYESKEPYKAVPWEPSPASPPLPPEKWISSCRVTICSRWKFSSHQGTFDLEQSRFVFLKYEVCILSGGIFGHCEGLCRMIGLQCAWSHEVNLFEHFELCIQLQFIKAFQNKKFPKFVQLVLSQSHKLPPLRIQTTYFRKKRHHTIQVTRWCSANTNWCILFASHSRECDILEKVKLFACSWKSLLSDRETVDRSFSYKTRKSEAEFAGCSEEMFLGYCRTHVQLGNIAVDEPNTFPDLRSLQCRFG